MQWHPDKFQEEEDKKKAEKKFMDIAAAKEVLTDEGGFIQIIHTFLSTDYMTTLCLILLPLLQRCVRSTTKGRILWTLRMVREVVEGDILSARVVTLSTSQVD